MTQMKYNIEYLVALAEKLEDINYGEIEDIQSDALLSSGGSGKYEKPTDILERIVNGL